MAHADIALTAIRRGASARSIRSSAAFSLDTANGLI